MRKIIRKPLSLKIEDSTALSGLFASVGAGASLYIQDPSAIAITSSTFIALAATYAAARLYSLRHPEVENKYTRTLIKKYKNDLMEYAESVEENYNKKMFKIEQLKQKRIQERDKQLNEIMEEFERIKEIQRKRSIKKRRHNIKK